MRAIDAQSVTVVPEKPTKEKRITLTSIGMSVPTSQDETRSALEEKSAVEMETLPATLGLPAKLRRVRELEQAIALLPADSNAAYCRALEQGIVHAESNPFSFLEFHKGDVSAAAKRLASYWVVREYLLEEKAYERLRWASTGVSGALSQVHSDELQRGSVVQLPTDSAGNVVLFLDRTRHDVTPADVSIRLQTMFYMLSRICGLLDNRSSEQKPPPSLVLLFTVSAATTFQTPCDVHLLQWIHSAFPISLKQVIVAGSHPTSARGQAFRDFVVPCAVHSLGPYAKPLSILIGDSKEELLERLKSVDLGIETLPRSLGGAWEYHDFFSEWRPRDVVQRPGEVGRTELPCGGVAVDKPSEEVDQFKGQQEEVDSKPPAREAPPLPAPQEPGRAPLYRPNIALQIGDEPLRPVNLAAMAGLGSGMFLSPNGISQQFAAQASTASHNFAFPNVASSLRTNQLLGNILSQQCNPPYQTHPTVDLSVLPNSVAGLGLAALGDDDLRNSMLITAMRQLPDAARSAYLEALASAPSVVERESNKNVFLRACDFDVVAAAHKLATYWTKRKELFGSRAFLPLTLSGEDALTQDDIVLLHSGSIAVLPDDVNGNGVVCLDRSRLLEGQNTNRQSRLRGVFYLASVLSRIEKTQSEGIVVIDATITPRVIDIDFSFSSMLVHLGEKALPLKLKRVHLVVCPPKIGKKSEVNDILANVARDASVFGDRVSILRGRSPADVLRQLKTFGLREDSLPLMFGGSWRYEEFNRSLRDQAQNEHRLASPPRTQERRGQQGTKRAADDAEQNDRKRRLNIVHSRQKRERRRTEMESLFQQQEELERENKRLREENGTLELLLQKTSSLVKSLGESELRQAGRASPSIGRVSNDPGGFIPSDPRSLQIDPSALSASYVSAVPDTLSISGPTVHPHQSLERRLQQNPAVPTHSTVPAQTLSAISATLPLRTQPSVEDAFFRIRSEQTAAGSFAPSPAGNVLERPAISAKGLQANLGTGPITPALWQSLQERQALFNSAAIATNVLTSQPDLAASLARRTMPIQQNHYVDDAILEALMRRGAACAVVNPGHGSVDSCDTASAIAERHRARLAAQSSPLTPEATAGIATLLEEALRRHRGGHQDPSSPDLPPAP